MHSNTLLVACREFCERVRSRGFLLSTLLMPVFLVVLVLVTRMGEATMEVAPPDRDAVQTMLHLGYVDLANLLAAAEPLPGLQRYADEQHAAEALRQGRLDAYYVIPKDYMATGRVQRVSRGLPSSPPDTILLAHLLRQALVAGQPPERAARLLAPLGDDGLQVTLVGQRGQPGPGGNMLPFLATAAVMVPLFTGGGLLLRSLAQEKESRIMEVLLVSLRPRQLLAGKVLGIGALVLVQYAAWLLVLALILPLSGSGLGATLDTLNLSAAEAAVVVLYGLGGFFLYAAVMAGVGALAPDVHSSQNWVFLVTLPMLLPLYLWMAVISAPHGALAMALSLFPFSAPIAMILRLTAAVVPAWQLGLSLLLLAATTVWITAGMARLFRAQVLLSGEPLSIKRFVQALRSP